MSSIAELVERASKVGDVKIAEFSGVVREAGNPGMEKGTVFTIPQNFSVYKQKIGNNIAQYCLVECEDGQAKRFYPSSMTKSVVVYDEDGTSTGTRVEASGTAVDEFRKHIGTQEAVMALVGKKIKVSDVKTVRTLRFGTDQLRNTQVCTFDLVG